MPNLGQILQPWESQRGPPCVFQSRPWTHKLLVPTLSPKGPGTQKSSGPLEPRGTSVPPNSKVNFFLARNCPKPWCTIMCPHVTISLPLPTSAGIELVRWPWILVTVKSLVNSGRQLNPKGHRRKSSKPSWRRERTLLLVKTRAWPASP